MWNTDPDSHRSVRYVYSVARFSAPRHADFVWVRTGRQVSQNDEIDNLDSKIDVYYATYSVLRSSYVSCSSSVRHTSKRANRSSIDHVSLSNSVNPLSYTLELILCTAERSRYVWYCTRIRYGRIDTAVMTDLLDAHLDAIQLGRSNSYEHVRWVHILK
jgi:hypothetical protein